MNRRDFGKMIVGTGVAAAVPVQGLAATAAASARRSKYIFAVALAHNRIDISAETISDTFNIRPHTARGLLGRLVRNGVVDAPNARGVARLAEPLQRIVPQVVEYNPAGGYVVKGPLDEFTARAGKAARKLLESEDDAPSDDVPDTAEETGAEDSSVAEAEPPEGTRAAARD